MRRFANFVVIDWSGEAVARPKGLALAHTTESNSAPSILSPAGGWSRDLIKEWLLDHARNGTDVLIGLDLSPALPFCDLGAYFPGWSASPTDAKGLWSMLDDLCASDPHHSVSSVVKHSEAKRHFRQIGDCGDLFPSGKGRLRECELGQAKDGLSPSSCFNLVGAAQVGKSSLTGMRVLNQLNGRIPVWPFDPIPDQGPLIVEIYTSIAARQAGLRRGFSKIRDGVSLDAALAAYGSKPHAPLARYTDHVTDAILTTAWLRRAAHDAALWNPPGLTPEIAATEGWTFGVL